MNVHRQPHRMPAPSDSAMATMIATTTVKRARFALTMYSLIRGRPDSGNRAACGGHRPLALRPRLAAGLPWTDLGRERQSPHEGASATGPTDEIRRKYRHLRPIGRVVRMHRRLGP